MSQVKLVSITPGAEKLIAYLARVSSSNQDNPEIAGLLRYLIKHRHWSPFEMCHAVVEINTTRAIAAQLLRHRSFSFQEISQRYTEAPAVQEYTSARRQCDKNRQSSTDPVDDQTNRWWKGAQYELDCTTRRLYDQAIKKGIAREQARFLLPLSTGTKLYMAGSIRSWVHYLELRTQPDTQQEHREIAEGCREILTHELPTIAEALGWKQ